MNLGWKLCRILSFWRIKPCLRKEFNLAFFNWKGTVMLKRCAKILRDMYDNSISHISHFIFYKALSKTYIFSFEPQNILLSY